MSVEYFARALAICRAKGIAPSRFGRDVMHDPRFVFDVLRGREPGPRTRARLKQWVEENDLG